MAHLEFASRTQRTRLAAKYVSAQVPGRNWPQPHNERMTVCQDKRGASELGAMMIAPCAPCAADVGLAPHEIWLGISPSTKHYTLLLSYLYNLERGVAVVREMIVADLRSFLDLEAWSRAADLLVVLRLFFSAYPEAAHFHNSVKTTPMRGNVFWMK
jgi:hypothetical protein